MKRKPYPKYKPSGVEWLGDVPEHWEVKRLKMAAHLTDKKVEADEEHPVPYIGMENIESWTGRLLLISPNVVPTGTANTFKVGHTLFGKLRPYLAKACNPNFDGLCSTELLVLKSHDLDQHGLLYLLLSDGFVKLVDSSTYGSKMPRASWDFIGNCVLPVPSAVEQRAIAAFLDRETGRIETLISKKRELVERLKEKRTALISHTVTHGLPPEAAKKAGLPVNPPLKHSGVAWLGDIPKHWYVKPVKHVARIGNGSTPNRDNPGYWEDGNYPWLNSSVVNQEVVTQVEDFVTPLALRECHLPKISPPAVLIGITGQGRTRGMASTLLIEATINQHVAYLKPHQARMKVGFLRRVFDMAYLFLRSESDGGGSTKGAITCDQIANLKIPVPPIPEQAAIAAYLDAETAKLDTLVAKIEEAVERLQAYRTALITAAVTGKIDVRGNAIALRHV